MKTVVFVVAYITLILSNHTLSYVYKSAVIFNSPLTICMSNKALISIPQIPYL